MELDINRPTDAEAWAYLVQHGGHITNDTHKVPKKMQDAIIEVLERNWDEEVVARIKIHDFGVIWSDENYKKLATKLWDGPAAEVFRINIGILNLLKTYRLEGYWDVLLENAADRLGVLFQSSLKSVSPEDFDKILKCNGTSKKYHINLGKLFWDEGEPHKANSRREEILSHLSATQYSNAYNALTAEPLKQEWNFRRIVEEITKYSSPAKKVMVHVASWYNPNLKEPHARASDKKPIHYHLEEYFRKLLPQNTNEEAEKAWRSKAIALQRIVVDFTKANGEILNCKFMLKTVRRSGQLPEVYHERFGKDTFWDCLARIIHKKMPEIPFQHPDLLPYNSTGENIYHSDQRRALGTPSSTHAIADLTATEGALVSLGIEDLIGQEYGSDTSPDEELFDPKGHANTSTRYKQTSSASVPTNYLAPSVHDERDPNDCDVIVDADEGFYDIFPSSTPPGSTGLGKRKTPKGFTPMGRPGRKIPKVKFQDTGADSETATGPTASAGDASQTPRNGRQSVHFFREQVRRRSSSPSESVPKPGPSSSANDTQQSPIGSIPRQRRRKMMTNLPDDLFDTPAPSLVEPTENMGESEPLTFQAPTLTAPAAPMFSATREVTPAKTTEISQAELPLSNEVKQEVQIMLDELVDKLDMKEQVNAVREQVFAAMKEQAVAYKLNIEEQVAAMKEQAVSDKLNIDQRVAAMKEQVVADKLNIEEQVAAMKEQVDADKLNTKEQIDANKLIMDDVVALIKWKLDSIVKRVEADSLNMKEQIAVIEDHISAIRKQATADKINMAKQVIVMEDQVAAMKEQVAAVNERIAATTATGTEQDEQHQTDIDRATDIVVGFLEKLNVEDQIVAFNAVRKKNTRALFLKLPAAIRERWLLNEIGIRVHE
ncbi:hypothetical protein VE03_01760 [Pseudogymnoascus sp. 23342-1-I1]|nr:hypothetical protein VE03_01760 [Pseudogymnoascus sp. 23342-1-I1]